LEREWRLSGHTLPQKKVGRFTAATPSAPLAPAGFRGPGFNNWQDLLDSIRSPGLSGCNDLLESSLLLAES
jgi:hypothetical protein